MTQSGSTLNFEIHGGKKLGKCAGYVFSITMGNSEILNAFSLDFPTEADADDVKSYFSKNSSSTNGECWGLIEYAKTKDLVPVNAYDYQFFGPKYNFNCTFE